VPQRDTVVRLMPASAGSGTGSGSGPGLRLRFRASVDSVPHARHRLSDWLAELDVPRSTIDDMALAITELVTNAVEASPSASAPILVHATHSGRELCIEVIDEGHGFSLAETTSRPGPSSIRGRGLPIVRALVDLVEVDRTDGRTRVVATCRLTRQQV
jgi:anti-sigma regulatory factor (Ser/Thr protein kinase)